MPALLISFAACLARLLVHRDHDNEIDLLGDEVLDLAEFRRDALLRIKAKQVDTLLCGLSLHRIVDRNQEWIFEAEQRRAHDLDVTRRYGNAEAEGGESAEKS